MPVQSRLQAAFEIKQHEAVLRAEGIAEKCELAIRQQARLALRLINNNDPFGSNQREAANAFRGTIEHSVSIMDEQFRRLAYWSYIDSVEVLTKHIPRRWFRMVNPVTIAVGEEMQLLPPGNAFAEFPEPVVDRMSDDDWAEFLKQHVFPPPSTEKITSVVYADVAGMNWQERMGLLSSKIVNFDQLAASLTAGASQGLTLTELTAQVQPHVNNIASSAKRIARTEGLRISTLMQREQYAQLGDLLAGAQIVATLDENTRPHHAHRNGTIYWVDRRKKPTIDDLPVLPDEPNCRCYDQPVLTEPDEFKNDPEMRAEFQNAANQPIPDPHVYSQWFDQADEGRRKQAVGVRRYNSMKNQLSGIRDPQFIDFIDERGKLMTITALRAETDQQRTGRLNRVRGAMEKRREMLAQVSQFGFTSKQIPPPKVDLPAPSKPPVVTPTPSSPFYQGNTSPVSKALAISGTRQQKATSQLVVELIDKIHGDGELTQIPLKWNATKQVNGSYSYTKSAKPVGIKVSKHSSTPMLTMAHEIGHFIDQQGIGKNKKYASEDVETSTLMQSWKKVIANSPTVKRIQELANGPRSIELNGVEIRIERKFLRYLTTDRELFARSYSQWIATRSQNNAMLKELKLRQPKPGPLGLYQDHWSDEEFEPIAKALDDMFTKLGWIE